MLSFLLFKYFAVSTCELFPRVQLVTIIFAQVSKNVALYYFVQWTARLSWFKNWTHPL